MRQGPWSGRPADEGSGSDELTPEPEEDSDVPRGPKPEFVTQTPRRPRSQGQGRAGHPGGRHKGQAQLLAGAGAPRVRGLRSVPEMLRTKPWALGHQARCYPGEGAHLLQVTSVGSCFPLPASAERSPPPKAGESELPPLPEHQRGQDARPVKSGCSAVPTLSGLPGLRGFAAGPFPRPPGSPKRKGGDATRHPPERGAQPRVFCRRRPRPALETCPVTDKGTCGDKPRPLRAGERKVPGAPPRPPCRTQSQDLCPTVLRPRTAGHPTVTGFVGGCQEVATRRLPAGDKPLGTGRCVRPCGRVHGPRRPVCSERSAPSAGHRHNARRVPLPLAWPAWPKRVPGKQEAPLPRGTDAGRQTD